MRFIITILTVLFIQTVFAVNPCKKCDIELIKVVNNNIDNLTEKIVSDFLCTFDLYCSNNTEFSEYSNETLFTVIEKNATLFFQVIAKENLDNTILLKEIESPINDKIDLQTIYDKVKLVTSFKDLKYQYLKAIILAAEKNGQKLKI